MTALPPASRRALVDALVSDLLEESRELRGVLAGLTEPDWRAATPADGWTVTDQITHLAYFDDVTRLSMTDPDGFRVRADELAAAGDDYPDRVAAQFHEIAPAELLTWFDRSRADLARAFREVDPSSRLPWFGPAMSPASSVTARLMETWAHGQDVLDTVGRPRSPTARMRHVADIGVRAMPYSYAVHGRPVPRVPVRIELDAPDGGLWSWGPAEAGDRVSGTALDFCLVVTQRRHLHDTGLEVSGDTAREWIGIAQAFAGPAGRGRAPARPGARDGDLMKGT